MNGANRKIVFLFLLLACQVIVIPLIAQKSRIKSRSEPSSLVRAEELLDTDPIGALTLLENYVKNSKSFNFEYQSRVYHLTGKANYKLNQVDLAINNYLKALDRSSSSYKQKRKISSVPVDPEVYYDLSIAYRVKRQSVEALQYAREYLSVIGASVSEDRLQGLLNLGHIQLESNDPEGALIIAHEANAMAESLENPNCQIDAQYLLGLVLEQQRNYDQALNNLNQAIVLSDSIGDETKGQNISTAIGRNYRAKNDRQNELNFKTQRRAKSIEENNPAQQNKLDLEIAELYIDMNQSNEAVPFLQESVELSEQLGDLEQNVTARKTLSDVYAEEGNYSLALRNYRSYVELVDQLYTNKQKEIELSSKVQQDLFSKQETISLMEKDRELRENEIALLEADRVLKEESLARQQLLIYGLTLLVIVILVSAFILYRNIQKKKLVNQLLALKSLRSQMNPHFIFNALNSVNSFISKNDSRKANKYLSDFSRLMRTVMENSQKDFVPLTEEIAMLELYLKLEHFRFLDKFEYQLDIESEILNSEYRIPPMLIQPYIENAIWHGLRYKEKQGSLSVTIAKKQDDLLLQVTDNGIGRQKSRELKTHNQQAQESTGMKNTENRINLLNSTYKSHIRCAIEDINNGEGTGTKVSVKIPLKLIEETI